MALSTLDISVICDDNVIIEINISNLTRVKEVIHQVICSRRSMSISIDLPFDDCILSIHDGSKLRLLSKESILFSLLVPKGNQPLSPAYKITASGFRLKAIEALQSANDHNYLIEKKSLELRYLVSSAGSKLPPDLASALLLTNSDFSAISDDRHERSGSSSSSSSNIKNGSALDGTSLHEFLLKKYLTFSNEIKEILRVEKVNLSGQSKYLLESAEDFLIKRDIPQLLSTAAEYDSMKIQNHSNIVTNRVDLVSKPYGESVLCNTQMEITRGMQNNVESLDTVDKTIEKSEKGLNSCEIATEKFSTSVEAEESSEVEESDDKSGSSSSGEESDDDEDATSTSGTALAVLSEAVPTASSVSDGLAVSTAAAASPVSVEAVVTPTEASKNEAEVVVAAVVDAVAPTSAAEELEEEDDSSSESESDSEDESGEVTETEDEKKSGAALAPVLFEPKTDGAPAVDGTQDDGSSSESDADSSDDEDEEELEAGAAGEENKPVDGVANVAPTTTAAAVPEVDTTITQIVPKVADVLETKIGTAESSDGEESDDESGSSSSGEESDDDEDATSTSGTALAVLSEAVPTASSVSDGLAVSTAAAASPVSVEAVVTPTEASKNEAEVVVAAVVDAVAPTSAAEELEEEDDSSSESESDSEDESGEVTETEDEKKSGAALAPVLFEPKTDGAPAVDGTQDDGSSSESDADSSDDEDEEEGRSSDDEAGAAGEENKPVDGVANVAPTTTAAAVSVPVTPLQEVETTIAAVGPKLSEPLIPQDSNPKELSIFGADVTAKDSLEVEDSDDSDASTVDERVQVSAAAAADVTVSPPVEAASIVGTSSTSSASTDDTAHSDDESSSPDDVAVVDDYDDNFEDDVPAKAAAAPAHTAVEVAAGKGTAKNIPDKVPKSLVKTGTESGSSSSSGEDEEDDDDDDVSVDYQPPSKKPPLALMQLLYKKPTAKFASCFLPPPKQSKVAEALKRKSIGPDVTVSSKKQKTAETVHTPVLVSTDAAVSTVVVAASSSSTATAIPVMPAIASHHPAAATTAVKAAATTAVKAAATTTSAAVSNGTGSQTKAKAASSKAVAAHPNAAITQSTPSSDKMARPNAAAATVASGAESSSSQIQSSLGSEDPASIAAVVASAASVNGNQKKMESVSKVDSVPAAIAADVSGTSSNKKKAPKQPPMVPTTEATKNPTQQSSSSGPGNMTGKKELTHAASEGKAKTRQPPTEVLVESRDAEKKSLSQPSAPVAAAASSHDKKSKSESKKRKAA